MSTTKNITYKNIDYPSGKPFVRYEKDRQIIFSYNTDEIITKQISRKKFTGLFFVTDMKGYDLSGKCSPNSTLKKRMDMVHFQTDPNNENMASSYVECVFLADGLTELIYADKKHKQLVALTKYNPLNRAPLQLIEYYSSGRMEAITNFDDCGLQVETKFFRDDEKSSLEELTSYNQGMPKLSVLYDESQQKTGEIHIEDASVGAEDHIEYEDGKEYKWRMQNSKTVGMIATENGQIIEEVDYNDNEQELTDSFYEYNEAGNLTQKDIYIATAWDENGKMISGHRRGFENSMSIFSSDFIRIPEDKFITEGLYILYDSPRSALVGWYKNGQEINDLASGRVMVNENNILSAYSQIEDKPKDWQPN
jgi:hypothetical protein